MIFVQQAAQLASLAIAARSDLEAPLAALDRLALLQRLVAHVRTAPSAPLTALAISTAQVGVAHIRDDNKHHSDCLSEACFRLLLCHKPDKHDAAV
jgi:hypothetical protein